MTENGLSPDRDVIGAVMVVGGGIAGMQASLDLADAGYKVYLVEQQSAIGGHMAQLDKTFPTNDCVMCTISPRLVEAGRHLNIEILTDSEVTDLDGAEAVVTMCPMCHMNLDARQPQIGLDPAMPVLHATQLAALAFGVEAKAAALEKNVIDPRPLLAAKVP